MAATKKPEVLKQDGLDELPVGVGVPDENLDAEDQASAPPQGSIYTIPPTWFKTVDIKDEHYQALLKLQREKQLIAVGSVSWLRLCLKEGYHYGLTNLHNNKKHYITGFKKFYLEKIKRKNDGRVRVRITG